MDMERINSNYSDEIQESVKNVLGTANYILGSEVSRFEQEFASYCGVKHGVGVGNGLEAIELMLRASGLGPGDEVLVPAHTFFATWLAVLNTGAVPVAVDVDLNSGSISISDAAHSVTQKTRAILVVHLYGNPADMESINHFADRHRLLVFEDAAQAHGASLNGRKVGSWGAAASFSFYPTKNLGALGDGGCVTTDSDDLNDHVRELRNYGSPRKYEHTRLGKNSRLDEVQAAILRKKLQRLDSENAMRRELAERYSERLAGIEEIEITKPLPGTEAVWHIFPIRVHRRGELQEALNSDGIGTLVHYPIPCHLQEAVSHLGYRPGQFPSAEAWAKQELSLPIYPNLDVTEVDYVCDRIKRWCRSKARR
jgi:dTDP-4-amino-4,6-dideoxygalactose transaminase